MPDLNYVSTDPSAPPGAATPLIETIKAGNRPGYLFGQYDTPTGPAGNGYIEFGAGTPGSLPFRVDQAGTVTGNPGTKFLPQFTPFAYGAKGDGVTDDTTAVQSAFAAAITAKGTVNFGSSLFKTTAPVILNGSVKMTGAAGAATGGMLNSASDLFTVQTGANLVSLNYVYLASGTGGGHIFNASGASVSAWTWFGCYLNQANAAKGIWYQYQGGLLDASIEGNTNIYCNTAASLSPFSFLACAGAMNSFRVSRVQCNGGASMTVPYFNFDAGYGGRTDTNVGYTAGSATVTDPAAIAADAGLNIYSSNFAGGSAKILTVTPGTGYTVSINATATLSGQTAAVGIRGWYEELKFDHVVFEICPAGAIWGNGIYDITIEDCAAWDVTATSDVYHFYTGLTGYWVQNISVRGGRGGAVTGAAKNFFADANCFNILLESFGQGWAVAPVISSPAGQTTIVNGINGVGVPANQAPATAITTPAVLTTTFANGTAAQLADLTRDYMLYLEIGTAGTAFTLSIGPTSGVANAIVTSAIATAGVLYTVRIPAGWFVKWAATTATIANQIAIGC